MKSSSNEIYVNGEYYNRNPTWDAEYAPWKTGMIYEIYKKNGLKPNEVVELGCGSGAILEDLARRDPAIQFLKGFDISPQALEIAKQKETDRISFYNDDITSEEYFHTDLLLVIDVFEHVDDYYSLMRHLKPKSDHFVFHIPLDLSCRSLLKPHVLKEQRNEIGHIHYFSKEMILWALADTGYEVVDWFYTKPVTDIQPAASIKRRIKKTLRNFSFNISKSLSAKLWGDYSMMILAR